MCNFVPFGNIGLGCVPLGLITFSPMLSCAELLGCSGSDPSLLITVAGWQEIRCPEHPVFLHDSSLQLIFFLCCFELLFDFELVIGEQNSCSLSLGFARMF